MTRLRVLHVTPYFADAWAYGGIPRVAAALTEGLAERGHEVTVCSTDACSASGRLAYPEGDNRFRPWSPTRTQSGVVVRVFPNVSNRLAYQQLFTPLGLGDYLQRSACAFDIAHLHACRNMPGVIAARHLRRAGVPYVLAPNGTAPRIERRRVAKRAFDVFIGSSVLRHATRVLAVSSAEREQLCSLGVAAHAIRLVPNPLEMEEFQTPPLKGRFRGAIGVNGPVILFLGRITPRKRLDVLVRAFAEYVSRPAACPEPRRGEASRPAKAGCYVRPEDSSRLVIAGNDAGAAGAAKRLAQTLGIGDRTVFTGLLSGHARLEALADADVVVYPSQDEVFGLVPLEALMVGTPVIVADDSGCAEIVQSVGGGLIVPVGDATALATAIAAVIESPSHWRDGAAQAAARVRSLYSSHVVCAALDAVYQEVVDAA
jgi:glycosyltransferase involved in cell wall biosynthesis